MLLSVASSANRSRRVHPPVSQPWTPAYSLPSTNNTSVLIGTNTLRGVRPSGYNSDADWDQAVFGQYGSGTMCQLASVAGRYIVSNSGGHDPPQQNQVVSFDFTDAAWRVEANGNGIASTRDTPDVSSTNGAPYFELNGASTGQMPCSSHLYNNQVYYPIGNKGTIFVVAPSAICSNSLQSKSVHRMDIETRIWTRASTAQMTIAEPQFESSVAVDSIAGRIYLARPGRQAELSSVSYLRMSDLTAQTISYTSNGSQGNTSTYPQIFIGEELRIMCSHSGTTSTCLAVMDLTNDTTIAQGYGVPGVSGAMPEAGNRWIWHPGSAAFYCIADDGNPAVLYKLKPPASNYKTSAWTCTQVAIGGGGLPARVTSNRQYSSLCFVPALAAIDSRLGMAWLAGDNTQVAILCLAP